MVHRDDWGDDTSMTSTAIRQQVRGQKDIDESSPSRGMEFGFSICKVLRVDYAAHEVSLQVLSGEDQVFQRTPIPIAYPGAGPRTFFGAIPEIGALCICGYLATKPRTPVIIGWLIGGPLGGMEWLPSQTMGPTELNMTPKVRAELEGIYNRNRQKLNHVRPGMIMASSAMGSDMILDEGVYLSNRRANEIRLRDQDQAFVVRSLQQFHAMGGARIYGGMVQRDATLLQSTMVSDGIQWDAPQQVDAAGFPIHSSMLTVDPSRPEGVLTPHAIFARDNPASGSRNSKVSFPSSLDPYNFLKNGLFIGTDGAVINSEQTVPDAEYGGKPMFRVSLPSPGVENTAVERNDVETLTEYRIELEHIWDGTLPVTEQTDGFDVDRQSSEPGDSDNPLASGAPFIEWVLGSVVGNAASTEAGRLQYAKPLMPVVFDALGTNPRFESGIGQPLESHAATLFRLTPPLRTSDSPSWASWTKDGRFKASVGGPPQANSVELALAGRLKIEAGGGIDLGGNGLGLNFRGGDPATNIAFLVKAESGAIKLSAGGATTEGSFAARTNPDALEENTLPALLMEAPSGNAHLIAGRIAKIAAANAIQLTDTNEVTATPKQSFNVYSSKFLCNVTTLDRTVTGKEQTMYSGPNNFLPTNIPLRSTKFIGTPLTGHIGGKTDEYFMFLGNRQERIGIGNHETLTFLGSQNYQAGIGSITNKAGVNSMKVSSVAGISAFSATTLRMTSTLSTTIKGIASVTLTSTGNTRVQGAKVQLNALPGLPTITPLGAGILSGADTDPTSGKKFSYFFAGSLTHRLGIKTV
jgi:hypothetical protein